MNSDIRAETLMRVQNAYTGIVLIAMFAPVARATSLEEIEQLVAERWGGITSFSANITMDMKVPLGAIKVGSHAEGTIELIADEDNRKYRIEMTNRLAKSFLLRDGLTQEILTVYDGEYEYTQMTALGNTQVRKRIPADADTNRPTGGRAVFDRLREQGELSYAGEANFDGMPVWVVEVKPNKNSAKKNPLNPDRIRVFISQESGLQVQLLMLDKKEKELSRVRYSNVQLNPRLNPTRFEYTPPQGVEILEADPSR